MTSERTDSSILKRSIVREDSTVEMALSHMLAEAAIIVDSDGRLSGILTDGDIRRALLSGASLQSKVSDVMTRSPITIEDGLPKERILAIMLSKGIRHLPVLDKHGRPLALELLKAQYGQSELAQAVLMAGGKGTRLQPLTNDTPKPLLKIGSSTILDNVLNGLESSGIAEVVISVNYLAHKIKDHVAASSRQLSVGFVEETVELGTAGSLSLLDPPPQRSFIVMNADLLTEIDFKSLLRFHSKEGNDLSVCVRLHKDTIPFGVISLDQDCRRITDIAEKPTREYMVNAGIYMLEPKILPLIPKDQFFDMVSLVNKAISSGFKVGAFPIYEYWRDIGRHEEMEAARHELSGRTQTQAAETTAGG